MQFVMIWRALLVSSRSANSGNRLKPRSEQSKKLPNGGQGSATNQQVCLDATSRLVRSNIYAREYLNLHPKANWPASPRFIGAAQTSYEQHQTNYRSNNSSSLKSSVKFIESEKHGPATNKKTVTYVDPIANVIKIPAFFDADMCRPIIIGIGNEAMRTSVATPIPAVAWYMA